MIKKLFILLLLPFTSLSQVQINQDIYSEFTGDVSRIAVTSSADSNIIAIEPPFDDINGNSLGQVRLFHSQGDNWIQLGVVAKNMNIYTNLSQFISSTKELTLDTSQLASGLYFVELVTSQRRVSQKFTI